MSNAQFAVEDAGQGILVQARVVARLFGMRLLSLDADVLTTKPKWRTPSPILTQKPRTAARINLPATSSEIVPANSTGSLSDATEMLAKSLAVLQDIRNDRP